MKNHYNVFIFTVLVFTLFSLTIPSAFADDITINDQESCEDIGGIWTDILTKICTVSSFTSDDNDIKINGNTRLISIGLLENTEDGSITINSNSILEIQSISNNYGYVENHGTIINNISSNIFNFGAIENSGTLTNNGNIFNGDLINGAEIINLGTVENNGLIHNYREIINQNIVNNPGIINNECGAIYTGNIPVVNAVVQLCTTDSDGDGLFDDDELNLYGTDPNNPDSDADGLTDYDEVITHLTDPNNPDSDADGLTDYDELNIYFTNPLNSDSDADGLTDGQEVQLGTDPNNALGDLDADGLTDSQEVLTYFTNPNNPDSDADGLTDYDEVITHLTNPNNPDSDADGLTDY
ncbi:MAG: hypothetical protein KGZ34_05860, partial [Nitrosarchaeum sp.]|nr:hypothetical protein [Nitrosarchaeum sp.]